MTTSVQPLKSRRRLARRVSILMIELALVLVIIALLLATWLPAFIGGNGAPSAR